MSGEGPAGSQRGARGTCLPAGAGTHRGPLFRSCPAGFVGLCGSQTGGVTTGHWSKKQRWGWKPAPGYAGLPESCRPSLTHGPGSAVAVTEAVVTAVLSSHK